MKKLEQYFSEDIPKDEQLVNTNVLNKGVFNALESLLTRAHQYYELLDVELDENPAGKLYLEESMFSVHKACEILKWIQQYAILDNSQFETFNLFVLLNGIANRLRKIELAELEITKEFSSDDEVNIKGDQMLLQQVLFEAPMLLNLTQTKKKKLYTRIVVRELDNLFFEARDLEKKAGEYIICSFSLDSGKKNLDSAVSIMKNIFSLSSSVINERLFFTYGIMLKHGGELLVNSTEEELSDIFLILPTQKNLSNMFADNAITEEELKGTETILLVDDEGSIWDVVIDMLQRLGYTVLLAQNGIECVEMYQENVDAIDLILLDMVMPQMSGEEAFFKLKEIDPSVCVLVQSGYIHQTAAQNVLKSGAYGFLKKPYRMRELAIKIREIFG